MRSIYEILSRSFILCMFGLVAACPASSSNGNGDDGPATPTCDDGKENGDEEGVDCGGSCFLDCDGTINDDRCMDGFQNGDEEGIDCGGTCPDECDDNASCFDGVLNGDEEDVDCGGSCIVSCGLEETPTCFDGQQNGAEEGIDCGGGCSACPTCIDGIQNGTEEGIDCGGPCDDDCPDPTCFDGVRNQGEQGVDCGGPCADCVAPPTCDDGILNQGEEQIDCGGANCDACPDPTCDDNILNQNEEDIDCGGVCAACPEPATPGDIVITEIMYNPECVGDRNGEWVEIQNRTEGTIDLAGWRFSDDDGTAGELDGVVLPAGGRAVLCANQNSDVNGGVTCDLQIPIGFSNSSDLIFVQDATRQTIDSVRWFSSFPSEEGRSIAISDDIDHIENDEGSNWFLSEGTVSATCEDNGTPGRANTRTCDPDCDGPEPTCDDGILNGDEEDVDCGGTCEACPAPPTCDDGIQNQGETGTDCGGPCDDCVEPEHCTDELLSGDEEGIDCGGSCARNCDVVDGNAIVFSEIMYNPSCVGDADGEWIEIRNVSNEIVNLQGWSITDDDSTGGEIGLQLINPGQAKVFCKDANSEVNGGIICDEQLPMVLGNSGDRIFLKNPQDEIVDEVDYTTFLDANGESLESITESSIDNDLAENWVVATSAIEGGCGDLGTPGI